MKHMVKMVLSELGRHSQLLLYGIKFLDSTPSSLFSIGHGLFLSQNLQVSNREYLEECHSHVF
jgi:hypothetical protein